MAAESAGTLTLNGTGERWEGELVKTPTDRHVRLSLLSALGLAVIGLATLAAAGYWLPALALIVAAGSGVAVLTWRSRSLRRALEPVTVDVRDPAALTLDRSPSP